VLYGLPLDTSGSGEETKLGPKAHFRSFGAADSRMLPLQI
jgi:hypothetical protein